MFKHPAEVKPFVTIVSGLPRSGTSMMMRMLEAGGMSVLVDEIRKPNEDNPKGYYEFEPVKQTKADPSWLALAVGKAVKMVYRLLYDLPADYTYRVLFMRRNLQEVLASQDIMLKRERENVGADADQIARLFRDELARYEVWIKKQANFQVLDVDYNGMLRSPEEPVERINHFLGSQLNSGAMIDVVDPTLYRNRR